MRKSIPMAIFIETRGARLGPPRTHRNEFPAEYSLASCSPAELASAFPAELILQPWSPFAKKNPANGSCRIYTPSHKRAQSNPHPSTSVESPSSQGTEIVLFALDRTRRSEVEAGNSKNLSSSW